MLDLPGLGDGNIRLGDVDDVERHRLRPPLDGEFAVDAGAVPVAVALDPGGTERDLGELRDVEEIRGEQVLKGYFRNEEGTTKAFEGGWFHTGDMARRDEEGFFYIVDRMKDMIITGGENVYSREVEEVLYTHPSVSEAAVVGLPDPVWGETVTAVVVLRADTTATEAEIIATARDRLAGFKKPKRVIFVDELPKTVSGKIIKRELRDRYAGAVDG